ncbi:MAG: uroporphyrinogen decarboxylase family protein [Candidatus Bathyarchaeia archaeon]
MNSKERVIASLERRKIDRVPVDLACGGPNSALEKLMLHFKVNRPQDLLDILHVDVRHISPRYIGPKGRGPSHVEWGIPTEFGGTQYMKCDYEPEGGIAGTYSDNLGIRPLKNCTSIKELENFSWPEVRWFDFDCLKEECKQYENYAVMIGGWSPILSRVFELFGIETALKNLYLRPSLIRETIRRIVDYYYEFFDTALSVTEGKIQIVGFGDDFASQQDLMINPKMWRDFCKEPLRRLFSLGEKHDVYVFFHSCGAIRKVIPDLIEIGMDILFPVQPSARGMDHAELKEEFGNNLAFWGGIDVQTVLPFGTPDDVRQYVRERVRILGLGGGYILSPSHNLLKSFPLENILAMYDEAMKIKAPC